METLYSPVSQVTDSSRGSASFSDFLFCQQAFRFQHFQGILSVSVSLLELFAHSCLFLTFSQTPDFNDCYFELCSHSDPRVILEPSSTDQVASCECFLSVAHKWAESLAFREGPRRLKPVPCLETGLHLLWLVWGVTESGCRAGRFPGSPGWGCGSSWGVQSLTCI